MATARETPAGPARSPASPTDADHGEQVELESMNPARRLAAEVVGTLLLTLVAAGGVMMAKIAPTEVGGGATAVAPALVVMAMVYAVSDVSGAHFNPAVTLGFALRGDFTWGFVPLY